MPKFVQGLFLSFFLVISGTSWASYAQFCKLDGVILNDPTQDENECIHFEFEVSNASEYDQKPFGTGWGNCSEHIGTKIQVSLTPPYQWSTVFRKGQLRSIWYDAMDMEIEGRMCTVVGYSAVDPNTVDLD